MECPPWGGWEEPCSRWHQVYLPFCLVPWGSYARGPALWQESGGGTRAGSFSRAAGGQLCGWRGPRARGTVCFQPDRAQDIRQSEQLFGAGVGVWARATQAEAGPWKATSKGAQGHEAGSGITLWEGGGGGGPGDVGGELSSRGGCRGRRPLDGVGSARPGSQWPKQCPLAVLYDPRSVWISLG